jgi:hypothetical protein
MTPRLAAVAEQKIIDAWTLFQVALSKRKGPYPLKELKLLLETASSYSETMKDSEFIHKSIASTFQSFRESLEIERKRVPGDALFLADRIETIIFSGYDPYFEGDEPPCC